MTFFIHQSLTMLTKMTQSQKSFSILLDIKLSNSLSKSQSITKMQVQIRQGYNCLLSLCDKIKLVIFFFKQVKLVTQFSVYHYLQEIKRHFYFLSLFFSFIVDKSDNFNYKTSCRSVEQIKLHFCFWTAMYILIQIIGLCQYIIVVEG